MKKMLAGLVVLSLGVALGRMFDGAPPRAEAGGGQGGGVEKCAAKNGDVNADGRVDLSDAVTVLGNLFLGNPTQLVPLCETQGSSGLPNTGQIFCYDQNGNVDPLINCPDGRCAGQDAFYATGCPSAGRFVDNGDGTVTDHCTGLLWQKNTADTNGDGLSTNQDFLPWCAALDYCENLSFAGHDDWRLPNVRELQSIVDYGRVNPAIAPVFGALSSNYWSSTSFVSNPGLAWNAYFFFGFVNGDDKDNDFHVRAVRSGP